VTFASAGFLIASILIFSLVALPELFPSVYPQLRYGTVGIRVISTSGELVQPQVLSMEVTVSSIAVHRVGVGEGAWITVVDKATQLDPVEISSTPVTLKEAKIPIGDYNLLRMSFGEATATIGNANVTLKSPTQELKISTAFTVSEGKHSSLVIDMSFNEPEVILGDRFDPYVTVTVEQPGHAPLSTIASLKPVASFGPRTLSPGESESSTFAIEPGSDIQNYLVHAVGGSGVENTFELEIVETGEFWYELTGDLWFLGGNLTAGSYHMNVHASDAAVEDVRFTVSLYLVPHVTDDVPDAAFSGLVPGESSFSIQLNEFALYLDQPGLYDFYLDITSGDYEFLVDNNPTSVISKPQTVTLQLDSGLHTFQVLTDFSGSGRDTSWTVGIVPVLGTPARPLSREAVIATALLIIAVVLFVAACSSSRSYHPTTRERSRKT
jgi:hypothetical protein